VAFVKSGLAEGSPPCEFADATTDHRQIEVNEVIGIEGTAVRETLVLGMVRIGHGIEELLEAASAAACPCDAAI
jgi:hypothetical protein